MKNKRSNSNVPSGGGVSQQPHQPATNMNTSHGNASSNNHKQSLQNSHVGVLNAKHLQNQTCKGIRKKNDVPSTSPSNSTENETSLLMKKLFEATQRQNQQQSQQQHQHHQQRNNVQINHHKGKSYSTSNSPKKNPHSNSNSFKALGATDNYAGAAFDRAPSGTSFPIPSFAKSTKSINSEDSMVSASCPLPNGLMTQRILQETTSIRTFQENNSGSIGLKSLSINDLFQKQPQNISMSSTQSLSSNTHTPSKETKSTYDLNSATPSPPIKCISLMSSKEGARESSNRKESESAEILTQNLRKILNLPERPSK